MNKKDLIWMDCKKAYDNIPHCWFLEYLRILIVNEKIHSFLEKAMRVWQVGLTCTNISLGNVKIRREWELFQGNLLSPLLFVIALIPLISILRKSQPPIS